ncbi:hypothetical protein CJA_0893 [Cellvibrio japonicus Ueda107]|uniref:Uncharacterized protein n=1 Tax=Cellvibrio japonicus (strain Ueda107) TaxID=498211 RepID=B3PL80_CELJU|nr:hypothetical protein CJA_0893 [Cellvibrio japonicus Ueda107]
MKWFDFCSFCLVSVRCAKKYYLIIKKPLPMPRGVPIVRALTNRQPAVDKSAVARLPRSCKKLMKLIIYSAK